MVELNKKVISTEIQLCCIRFFILMYLFEWCFMVIRGLLQTSRLMTTEGDSVDWDWPYSDRYMSAYEYQM